MAVKFEQDLSTKCCGGNLASSLQRNEIHSGELYSTIKIVFSWHL